MRQKSKTRDSAQIDVAPSATELHNPISEKNRPAGEANTGKRKAWPKELFKGSDQMWADMVSTQKKAPERGLKQLEMKFPE